MELESQPSATGATLTRMTFGWDDALYSFATWMDANLEKNLFKCCLWCQKTEV